jgi:spectinomycin phosphotransferase
MGRRRTRAAALTTRLYHPPVFVEPKDLDRAAVLGALTRHWAIAATSLRYEPVGFGSHHYVPDGPWFVNVDVVIDDGSFDRLDRALRTTVALRRAGLGFVGAPFEADDGTVLARIDDRYALSVYPFIDGRSRKWDDAVSPDERRAVLGALGRLHAVSDTASLGLPRRDDLAIPLRDELFSSLDDLGSGWEGGPFSERARGLFVANAPAVRERFERYDDLAGRVRELDRPWVITHGEPHVANTMWRPDGSLVLIDWDTVAVAPSERDLWMVEPKDDDDLAAYTSCGGVAGIGPDAISLYRLGWSLSEIALCTHQLRSPHADDANTRTTWDGLVSYVSTR